LLPTVNMSVRTFGSGLGIGSPACGLGADADGTPLRPESSNTVAASIATTSAPAASTAANADKVSEGCSFTSYSFQTAQVAQAF
jgi:hypothetical protein